MDYLRPHYRILHRALPGREPACALVEVLYNGDGSIAATMDPVFSAVSPHEVLFDLRTALEHASAHPPITYQDVVGDRDDPIPF